MKKVIKEKGMILITVLLLAVLLTMLTVSMVFISTNHLQMMGNVEQKIVALKAAEAIAEYALAELNRDPTWGTARDASENLEIKLENSSASINFIPNTAYVSYNNLKGQSQIPRDFDTAIKSGNIAAYTAEIICKGIAGEDPANPKAVKYIKVVFIRSDIYPYPLISYGQIYFDTKKKIRIYGDDASSPGFFHSNWEGTGDPNDGDDYYSILSAQPQDDIEGKVDAGGGVASAEGPIAINIEDPNLPSVIIAANTVGKQDFEDLDIEDMLAKGIHQTSQTLPAGNLVVTPIYHINDEPTCMLNAYLQGTPILSGEEYYNNLNSSLRTCPETPEETGLTAGWDSGTAHFTQDPTFNDIVMSEAVGVSRSKGGGGWDVVEVTKYSLSASYTVEGEKTEMEWGDWDNDPCTPDTEQEVTRTVTASGGWSPPGTGLIADDFASFESTYQLSPHNWIDDLPPASFLEASAGGISIAGSSANGVILCEEGKAINPETDIYISSTDPVPALGNMRVSIKGHSATLTLTEDLHINGSRPDSNDHNRSSGSLVDSSDIIGSASDKTLFVTGGKFKVNGNELHSTVKLDLGGHNLYSDVHMIINGEVKGEGTMISRGKLAYVYGLESNDIVAMSIDDLEIGTSHADAIHIHGFLYSDDDLRLEPRGHNSAISTPSGLRSVTIDPPKTFDAGSDNVILNTMSTEEDAKIRINVKQVGENEYIFTIPEGSRLSDGSANYSFESYRVQMHYKYDPDLGTYTLDTTLLEKTPWGWWAPCDPSPPGYDTSTLNDMGLVIAQNLEEGLGDIEITGTLVSMNCNTNPEDNHANKSLSVDGDGMMTLYYGIVDSHQKIVELRGDDFRVRKSSWSEIN